MEHTNAVRKVRIQNSFLSEMNMDEAKKPPLKTQPARRKCLGRTSKGELHGVYFNSEGPGDRICAECKNTVNYKQTLE
jgi:hypothetical protein